MHVRDASLSIQTLAVLTASIVLAIGAPAPLTAQNSAASEREFQFADRGGVSLRSSGNGSGEAKVSYGRVRATGGSTIPPGFGIFGRRDDDGVMITETTVPAVSTIETGRTYAVFVEGRIDTAIAIANPNDQVATIDFYFTDTNSNRVDVDFGEGSFTLAPNQQISRFLSQTPFDMEPGLQATFTFSSSLPVAAVALTQLTNASGDVLYNTLPVVDLSRSFSSNTVFVPHVATGGTWSTDFILINPTDQTIAGQLIFVSRGTLHPQNPNWDDPGLSTQVSVNNGFSPVYDYVVGPKGMSFYRTTLPLSVVQTYSAQVRPVQNGGPTPVVQVVLSSFRVLPSGGVSSSDPVSQAAFVADTPSPAFRLYVETRGDPGAAGSIRSGFAIRNVDFHRATITAVLTDLSGNLRASTTLPVPASGQRAYFLDEIFPDFQLGSEFRGVLRLSTVDQDFAVVGLRTRRNERDEFQITTTPPSKEARIPDTEDVFVPHLVEGGGWTTEAVFFSGTTGQAGAGVVEFFGTDGAPLPIPLQ